MKFATSNEEGVEATGAFFPPLNLGQNKNNPSNKNNKDPTPMPRPKANPKAKGESVALLSAEPPPPVLLNEADGDAEIRENVEVRVLEGEKEVPRVGLCVLEGEEEEPREIVLV